MWLTSGDPRIVTLIHGTILFNFRSIFRRGEPKIPWIEENSFLRRALQGAFGDDLIVEKIEWSGRNDFTARELAAEKLRLHIRDVDKRYPGSPHYLIGHSHAGNIIMLALADQTLSAMIAGAGCLSTPFIHVRKRHWSAISRSVLPMGAGVFVLFLISLFQKEMDKILSAGVHSSSGWVQTVLTFIASNMAGLFVVALILVSVIFAPWIESSIKSFGGSVDHVCQLERDQLLIIRTAADEASGALSTFHFANWLIGQCWRPLARMLDFGSRLILQTRPDGKNELKSSAWSMISYSLLIVIVLMALELPLILLNGYWPKFLEAGVSRWRGIGEALMWVPFLILVTPLAAAALYFSILLPFAAPIAVLALFFGPEYALNAFRYEVSVEPTPPGLWEIYQLPLSSTTISEGRNSHSTAEDNRVPAIIIHWIRQIESAKTQADFASGALPNSGTLPNLSVRI